MDNPEELVKKFEDKNRRPKEGFVTDFFGCITNIKHYRHLLPFNNQILGYPNPSDGILHEFIEYVGTCYAIDKAKGKFSCVELGAGNGIWCARTGVIAKRKGIKNINLIAVEADSVKSQWISDNFNDNKLKSGLFTKINTKIYNKAIGYKKGFLYFPKIKDPDYDYGSAPSLKNTEADYRGNKVENFKIEIVPINEVITEITDLVHIDIQGGESELLKNSTDCINKLVKVIVLGTHSRKIEGDMIELFYNNKWDLLMEKPCQFIYNNSVPSLEGMTSVDGNQVWVNTKLINQK